MEPGRELDALIAAKVLGIVSLVPATYRLVGGPWVVSDLIPYYSTDIKDAWEVMEWLWEKDEQYLIWPDGLDGEEGYSVALLERGEDTDYSVAWAKTAPHAICLAALKVIEVSPNP
jgi:hypothetical protein